MRDDDGGKKVQKEWGRKKSKEIGFKGNNKK